MEEVLLIFDIGKTNKKVFLFDRNLKPLFEEETRFEETIDDEGFPCEDGALLESWIRSTLHKFLNHSKYLLRGINIATYGATLVCLDEEGRRLTPLFNYLKPLPDPVLEGFYESHGGLEEFSRRTASPSLGMLNSGLQILWLKRSRPELFSKVRQILHLPQYIAYLLHGKITSEHTSIGCHTAMWDFDSMHYHPWLKEEGISLPEPRPVSEVFPVKMEAGEILAGIGIHDSSSSLAPYIMAAKEPFILVSTGTWCISMNPSNQEALTTEELRQDCLCFLGVHGRPVKSSRFFLGRIHDLHVERIQQHFKTGESAYKKVNPGVGLIKAYWESGERGLVYFRNGIPGTWVDREVDLRQFGSFDEAYTRLMVDLSRQAVDAIGLIISEKDNTKHLYITGGFAKNSIFVSILSLAFPGKQVFVSEVDNSTSLGAAIVIAEQFWEGVTRQLDLGLTSPAPHHPPH